MTPILASIQPWLSTHPAFVALVFWPLFTGGVNLIWKDADLYALTHPRFAAAKKLAQKWGLSPRGTVFLVAKMVGLVPPSDPPADSGITGALAIPSVSTPTLLRAVQVTLGLAFHRVAIVFVAAVLFALSVCGCHPTPDAVTAHANNVSDAIAYGRELDACREHDAGAPLDPAKYEACAQAADRKHHKAGAK
jgi:hypothetical protein